MVVDVFKQLFIIKNSKLPFFAQKVVPKKKLQPRAALLLSLKPSHSHLAKKINFESVPVNTTKWTSKRAARSSLPKM